MNYFEESLKMHEKYSGKLEIKSKVKIATKEDLGLAYTPGVAEPCRKFREDGENVYKYTAKGNIWLQLLQMVLLF